MSLASTILHRASTLLAHAVVAEETIREIAQMVGSFANLDSIRITISNPVCGTSIAARYDGSGSGMGGVVVSRDLRFAQQDYGSIELRAVRPKIRAVELFQFLSALESILLNFAVLRSRQSERGILRARLHLMEEELRSRKYTALAQSILANQGYAAAEAQAWLEEESRRNRSSISMAAERFIRKYRRQQSEAA